MSQAKTSRSLVYACVLHNGRLWICILVAMTIVRVSADLVFSIYYVLLVLFLCVLQVCVVHISGRCFFFTSDKNPACTYVGRWQSLCWYFLRSRFYVLGWTFMKLLYFALKFYVVLWNSRVIDDGLYLHCFSKPKAINSPEKPFLPFIENWKTSTFISKPCLLEQTPDLSRLSSFIPFLSVCQTMPCLRSPLPFHQESSTALWRMKCFSPSALQEKSLSPRHVAESY